MKDRSAQPERPGIIVGRPLPFSVFAADGRLLLAEGSIVRDDSTRYLLMRDGVYHDAAEAASTPGTDTDSAIPPAIGASGPFEALRRDYGESSAGRRFALSITASRLDDPGTGWVIGAHQRSIVLTAPRDSAGALLPLRAGDRCVCRAFQMTSGFRFRSSVQQVLFEPFPQILIETPEHVERRMVRSRPRAAVFVPVTVEAQGTRAGIMVDLSVSGGRLALEAGTSLERGAPLRIGMSLDLIDSRFELALHGRVVTCFGACDGRHPDVHFHGIRFERANDFERLVLHGYVSGQLALEANSLWRLLSAASPVIAEEKA